MLLDLNNIINFILNYIFISVPQMLIFILLILFLLKEYDYFKLKNFKQTVIDVFFMGTIQGAFIMNYLLYYTDLNLFVRIGFNSLIYLFFINQFLKDTKKKPLWQEHLSLYGDSSLLKEYGLNNPNEFRRETNKYIFIIEDNKPKFKYKNKVGIYIYTILIFMVGFIVEASMSFYLQYFINLDMSTKATDILNNIWFAYPELIILSFGVYLCFLYANNEEVTIFKVWKNNRKFRITTYIQSITTFIYTLGLYVFIVKNNLLYSMDVNIAFKIAITLYLLLILHVIIPWIVIFTREMLKYKKLEINKNL